MAGTNRIIGQPDTRRADRPKQLVLLYPASQRVEEPVLVVPLNLRGVVIVGALQGLIEPEATDFFAPRSSS